MNLTQSLQEKALEDFDQRFFFSDGDISEFAKINIEKFVSNLVAEVVEKTEKRVREEMVEKVNRVEVIDDNGRAWGIWQDGIKVKLDLQDEGRTLKLFVTQPKEENESITNSI